MFSIHIQNFFQIILYSGLTFLLTVSVFPHFIEFVQKYKLTQKIRDEDMGGKVAKIFAKLHAHKAGTPTMGGAVIVCTVLVVVVISRVLSYFGVVDSSLLNRGETYLPIFTFACVGILGIIDDYLNITERSKQKGLSARIKLWSLVGFALLGAIWFFFKLEYSSIHVPAVGDFEIGLLYIPLFVFVVVGSANAVNFTDGLDGLAGGLSAIAFAVFGVIAYAYELPILATFCFIVVAAIIAFLWFNVPPASVFMGDAGSLPLGATIGVIVMMTDSIFVWMVVCLVFGIETLSVIMQLFSKKFFKRKIFLVAPIHHHFEAKGWSETQITMRFWILGGVVGMLGLILGLVGMGEKGLF